MGYCGRHLMEHPYFYIFVFIVFFMYLKIFFGIPWKYADFSWYTPQFFFIHAFFFLLWKWIRAWRILPTMSQMGTKMQPLSWNRTYIVIRSVDITDFGVCLRSDDGRIRNIALIDRITNAKKVLGRMEKQKELITTIKTQKPDVSRKTHNTQYSDLRYGESFKERKVWNDDVEESSWLVK